MPERPEAATWAASRPSTCLAVLSRPCSTLGALVCMRHPGTRHSTPSLGRGCVTSVALSHASAGRKRKSLAILDAEVVRRSGLAANTAGGRVAAPPPPAPAPSPPLAPTAAPPWPAQTPTYRYGRAGPGLAPRGGGQRSRAGRGREGEGIRWCRWVDSRHGPVRAASCGARAPGAARGLTSGAGGGAESIRAGGTSEAEWVREDSASGGGGVSAGGALLAGGRGIASPFKKKCFWKDVVRRGDERLS